MRGGGRARQSAPARRDRRHPLRPRLLRGLPVPESPAAFTAYAHAEHAQSWLSINVECTVAETWEPRLSAKHRVMGGAPCLDATLSPDGAVPLSPVAFCWLDWGHL